MEQIDKNKQEIIGIGIETSCDETGISIISNGKTIIENFLFSQEELHSKYGGVVPEIASRNHLIKLPILLKDCLKKYGNDIEELQKKISYVSVTVRPGLVGSLLIGYNCALAISQILNKPLIPIHHLEAHLYATFIENDIPLQYPFIGGIFSGGNTVIYQVKELGNLKIIGETLDDSAGEALDKAAKMLGLPYPGGKIIDSNAKLFYQICIEKNYSLRILEKNNPFPKILEKEKNNHSNLKFSFSGIKTALLYYLKSNTIQEKSLWKSKNAICFFFLQRIIQIIITNLKKSILLYPSPYIIIAGGVCANSFLRKELKNINKPIYYPSPKLCTDNAAMIGVCAYQYYIKGLKTKEKVTSNSSFENWLL